MSPAQTAAQAAIAQRNAYVEANLDLVDQIAAHIAKRLPPCFELDDLKQAGALGLIDAAAKYKRSLNVPFRFFAQIRIRGEILESIRRRRYRDATHAELEAAIYERPDQTTSVVSIDQGIAAGQVARRVRSAMDGLGDADRKVLEIYYYRQERLAGVGEEFGVRQSRSSQLLQRAHRMMQRQLLMHGITKAA